MNNIVLNKDNVEQVVKALKRNIDYGYNQQPIGLLLPKHFFKRKIRFGWKFPLQTDM